MTNAVETTALTKRFGRTLAVADLDLVVRAGEVYGFLGSNGAGKTTTLRMLLGLIRPTSGSVRLHGRAPGRQALRDVGALIEGPAFYPYLSGRANLRVLAGHAGVGRDRVETVLEIVDLTDRAEDRYATYSLGMKQRLGVAAALLKDPRLLVLDEPTNGLDPAGMAEMRETIRGLARDGRTVLLSSHLLTEVEQICDRVGVIHQGRLITETTIAELRGGGTLRVVAEPVDLARKTLETLLGAANVLVDDDGFELTVDAAKAAEINAELAKQVRRPAHWLLVAIAGALTLTFAYLIPYASYTGTTSDAPGSGRGLDSMLPGQFIGNAVAGTPVFAGALALVAGVLVAGSEYTWDTWKTVLTQGPGRLRVYAAKLVTVAAGTLLMVLVLFGIAAAASAVVAALEDRSLVWPSLADLATGAGAGWLALTMWAVLGVLLGIALRGVALPIGLGLVWMLAVQNLLAAIAAPLLDWAAELQKALPGPNVGSLVAELGANEETPGVDALVGAGQATMVVAAYLLVFAVLGGVLLRRRDVL